MKIEESKKSKKEKKKKTKDDETAVESEQIIDKIDAKDVPAKKKKKKKKKKEKKKKMNSSLIQFLYDEFLYITIIITLNHTLVVIDNVRRR